jgi:hypothetical protein
VGVGTFLGVNFAWQIYAARQVKIRFHPEYYARGFVESVRRSPNETVFISSQLSRMLRDLGMVVPGNVVTEPSAAYMKVAFLQSESADVLWQTWPSNRWGMYEKVFGPLEVNLEAYTTFIGNQRILLVNRETLQTLPIKETDLINP